MAAPVPEIMDASLHYLLEYLSQYIKVNGVLSVANMTVAPESQKLLTA
jgi:hypothetical protein